MNWRVILVIAQKDVVDAIKNRFIVFSLILPFGLWLLLRLLVPVPDQPRALTIAVYDPDASRLAATLREMPEVQVVDVGSAQDVRAAARRASGGLALPDGFDATVAAGEQPEVTVYINRRRGGGEQARFLITTERQVWALAGEELPARVVLRDVGALAGVQGTDGFQLERYFLIMLLVMGLAMAGVFMVPAMLVEEKEKHTLHAVLLSPASAADVVAGKALTGLVYSLVIAGALLALNRGWAGNWPATVLVVLLGSLFSVTVGLLMGGLSRNTMQLNTWSSMVLILLMLPSWVILFDLPPVLDAAMHVLPTYYLTRALAGTLAGQASLAATGLDLAILAGSTAVVFAGVVWSLQREER